MSEEDAKRPAGDGEEAALAGHSDSLWEDENVLQKGRLLLDTVGLVVSGSDCAP